MIKSMTGFGKASSEYNTKKITAEIRSLNSKQLDLNLRLSSAYKAKEMELRTEISKQVERGKVDVSIYTESTQVALPAAINRTLATAYYNELKSLSEELKEKNTDLLQLVMKMPDVLKPEQEAVELEAEEWAKVRTALDMAIREFQKFREDEGKTLSDEFESRINIIAQLLTEVESIDAARIENVRERIKTSLEEVIEKAKIDNNRFEEELIYYIEKFDITEEKLRLKTHLDYFVATMKEEGSGRKLGFISQEIGREINTLGSKANDAAMQKFVVQMKDELEKIKEQLLNVL